MKVLRSVFINFKMNYLNSIRSVLEIEHKDFFLTDQDENKVFRAPKIFSGDNEIS